MLLVYLLLFFIQFWNTLSNIFFLIAAIRALYLVHVHQLPRQFLVLAWSIMLTGICSAWFHATLSYNAQKWDETFENIILIFLFYSDSPNQVTPVIHAAFSALGIFTVTMFLFCEIHLISMVIITLRKVNKEVTEVDCMTNAAAGLSHHLKRSGLFTLTGAICWLVDRLACYLVSQTLPFNPQLHAFWHFWCALAIHEAFALTSALYLYRRCLDRKKKAILPLVVPGFCGLACLTSIHIIRDTID